MGTKGAHKWSYMSSSNPNYGVNSVAVEFGPMVIYFSYDTVVAFSLPGEGLVVSENLWGPTTGKHINSISGVFASKRIDRDEFEKRFNALMTTIERAIYGTIACNASDLGVIINT